MSTKPVICNTSPLIGLSGLNLLSLLRDLYTEVWIPPEVQNEFLAIDESINREVLNNAPWIRIVHLTKQYNLADYRGLDGGEAEVLALAKEHNVRFILLDEKKARRKAKEVGLLVKGTVGILVEAKEKGLINTVAPLIVSLQDNGMHLSDSLITTALQAANEI